MRSRTPLVIAALVAGLLAAPSAGAQEKFEIQTPDATTAREKPKKGKLAKPAKPAASSDAPAGRTPKASGSPDRQFGELEGWSPGKAPPKPAEKDNSDPAKPKTPVSMTPEGHMGIGLPF